MNEQLREEAVGRAWTQHLGLPQEEQMLDLLYVGNRAELWVMSSDFSLHRGQETGISWTW